MKCPYEKQPPHKTCDFCQQATLYAPITVLGKRTMKIFWCSPCSAEYVVWHQNLITKHLYTTIDNKMYRWTVSSVGSNQAQIWFIEKPGIPNQQPNEGLKLLSAFDNYPEITPQNINEKLRIWLPFL